MDCCIVPPNSRTCHQLQLNRLRDLAVATATCLLGYNEWYVKGGGQQQRPGKADPLVGWEEGRNQRPQPLQELVLGGVLSPGEVSSPGLWPAVVWWSERNVIGTNIFESLREGGDRLSSLQNHTQVGITDVLRWVRECEEGWSQYLCQDRSSYISSVCWWRDGDWPRWSALPVVCRVKMWSTVEKERYCPGGDHFLKLLLKISTVRCSLSFDDISLRFTFTFCEVEEKHHTNFPVVCRTWSGPECRNMLCKENIFIELSCAWIRGLGK